MGRMNLEKYNVAIQDFHDSLHGLDSVIQEATDRCDKARLACGEARLVFEDKQPERGTSRSQFRCQERDGIEEQYLLAVIDYGEALNPIQLRPRVVNEAERHRIERARGACRAAFKVLEDHERKHQCARARSTRERANASSAQPCPRLGDSDRGIPSIPGYS
jgi:hypothetical protein